MNLLKLHKLLNKIVYYLQPLSFEKFLHALGEEDLQKWLMEYQLSTVIDCGLQNAALGLNNLEILQSRSNWARSNKGGLAEQFIGQNLYYQIPNFNQSNSKHFKLLSLPFYLLGQLQRLLAILRT